MMLLRQMVVNFSLMGIINMTVNYDNELVLGIDALVAKQEELRAAETKPSWSSNAIVSLGTERINIITATQYQLVRVVADLLQQQKTLVEASAFLGIEHDGKKVDELLSDCKLRMTILREREELAKVGQLIARLKDTVSDGAKKSMAAKELLADDYLKSLLDKTK